MYIYRYAFKQPIQGKIINKSILNMQYVSESWLADLKENTLLGAHCLAFIFRSWARIHLLNWNSQSKTLHISMWQIFFPLNHGSSPNGNTWASGWSSRHEVLVSKEPIDPPGVFAMLLEHIRINISFPPFGSLQPPLWSSGRARKNGQGQGIPGTTKPW